jgi:hypothetical protein
LNSAASAVYIRSCTDCSSTGAQCRCCAQASRLGVACAHEPPRRQHAIGWTPQPHHFLATRANTCTRRRGCTQHIGPRRTSRHSLFHTRRTSRHSLFHTRHDQRAAGLGCAGVGVLLGPLEGAPGRAVRQAPSTGRCTALVSLSSLILHVQVVQIVSQCVVRCVRIPTRLRPWCAVKSHARTHMTHARVHACRRLQVCACASIK